jgi:REP element-mobilizing transposase RayT
MDVTAGSYRPRNPGHDYYGKGIYLITLVVREREPLLGSLAGDAAHPEVLLSPLGEEVRKAWEQTSARQAEHGNHVVVHACVCMPDHFHGVIEVLEPMQWCLGDIMQAFKSACTSWWQRSQGLPQAVSRPLTDIINSPTAPAWLRMKAQKYSNESELIRNLSKYRRQEYYALVGRAHRPLFDENYDDTVCIDRRHFEAMVAYVKDNPRRAIMRRTMPDVMRRSLHVQIGGRDYGIFGNLFLLRWANKIQVQCHRRHPVSLQPYELTADYALQREQWLASVLGGATVIVTPGISRGELLMKNECLERGFPLIHIQKEPINNYWKPELSRFEACAKGRLLILAPWKLDKMDAVNGVPADTDYSRFHNLNKLAAEICSFTGFAKIIKDNGT